MVLKNEDSFMSNSTPKNPYRAYTYKSAKLPVIIWLVITFSLTLFLQNYRIPLIYKSVGFSVVLLIFGLLVWYQNKFFRHDWQYFLVQGFLVSFCFYLMPNAYAVVTISLYSILVAQSVGMYDDTRKVLLVGVYVYILFCLNIIFIGSGKDLLTLVAIMLPVMFCFIGYAKMFYHQIHARMRTQGYLEQLENAYQKVKELSVANERQRMARDLHDTLAQGIAGLSMQLEAVKANLNDSHYARAEEIVDHAAKQVRTMLHEARSVIDDLRSYESSLDFQRRIESEVQRFSESSGINCTYEVNVDVFIPILIREHLLRITNELLTNISNHAEAQNVWLFMKSSSRHTVELEIRDDGNGFDIRNIEQKQGHYGLIGIKERVRILDGTIEIDSNIGKGTLISLQIPLGEGRNTNEKNLNRR